MRAFVLERYGGPESARLRDMPEPVAQPGDVRIRVAAAGLNPVDYKIRQGKIRVVTRYPLPIVMGCELAGIVDSCGAGVTRFHPGDHVFARVDKRFLGAFAETVTVHESLVAEMPACLDFEHAAGVPLAALTALQALRDELKTAIRRLRIPAMISGGALLLVLAIARLAVGRQKVTSWIAMPCCPGSAGARLWLP